MTVTDEELAAAYQALEHAAYKRGYQDCLAMSAQFSGLKPSLDRLADVLERWLDRADSTEAIEIEQELEAGSALWHTEEAS